MPYFDLSPGFRMFYYDDDFTDPWTSPDAAIMLHGACESGLSWNGWMPRFARRFRVIRPDIRGFGQSTPMPADHQWSVDELVGDFERLVDSLGIERLHVVGAKLGGPMAVRLATRRPKLVRSLTLAGIPESTDTLGDPKAHEERHAKVQRDGVAAWARETMPSRLGSACSPEMLEGWTQLMARTPLSTHNGFGKGISRGVDIRPDIPKIECPTLVISTEGTRLGSIDVTRAWQAKIPRSELLVLKGDSYHAAATHPDECASAALAFIDRHHCAEPAASRR